MIYLLIPLAVVGFLVAIFGSLANSTGIMLVGILMMAPAFVAGALLAPFLKDHTEQTKQ